MKQTPTLWTPENTSVNEVQIIYKRPVFSELSHVTCSQDAYDIFSEFLGKTSLDVQEFFWVMTLNCANRVLGIANLSKGNINSTPVSIPMIAQAALLTHGCSVILLHNHPSGQVKPSRTDRMITVKISTALAYLDIKVLDHLILTSEGYSSLSDEGMM